MKFARIGLLKAVSLLIASTFVNAADFGEAEKIELGFSAFDGDALSLKGIDARRQLVITGVFSDGDERDLSRKVKYTSEPAGIVAIDETGWVSPVKDGKTKITVTAKGGAIASAEITVEESGTIQRINFPNEITPLFSKYGCNGGGCHGKSGGQNGFRLSLLGFEPHEDYEYIVKEARGRRVFPAAPDRSLLLTKATNDSPHGGGARIEKGSLDYRLIHSWIAQGMPYGKPDDPTLESIAVFPKVRIMDMEGEQQLVVTAKYSDGSMKDVTRSSVYEANDEEVGEVDENAHVGVFEQPGDLGVMIRYQDKVAVFRAIVPLGAPVDNLPPARNYVDEFVFAKLKAVGMPPSEICDDSTFIRRVSIDIGGRLPTPEEAKAFLADKDENKRDKLIDRLLASTDYANFFANKWSSLLRNKRTKTSYQRGNYAFHAWVRDSLHQNKPYDQFVREVVAASGEMLHNPAVGWYREVKTVQNQLEDTAQLFLGTRIQCAQCHHHPFEKWSQKDYYQLSAFFSQVGRAKGRLPDEDIIYHKRGIAKATNKKDNTPVQPAGLGAQTAVVSADDDPRQALVDWMSAKDNPFFAHTFVNRYWKHFFGRGLVDPEDDMRETNPAVNPELLQALAKKFIESGFDMKGIIRDLCRSKTYQFSSIPNRYNAKDKHNFSRHYPQRLQAEVLLDSIDDLTEVRTGFSGLPVGTRATMLPDNSFNQKSYFLSVFGRPDNASACECERSGDASLAQSLHLINSKDIQTKLSSGAGRANKLANDKEKTDAEKIEELYFAAFSRAPKEGELKMAVDYVNREIEDDKGVKKPVAKKEAYEDVVWALFNTKEFLFNL
ncbi:MAG: DUF1549 domain-containing protein [Opitutae bacterium]|nr:DUF1549 domain-containing protein [Opitutae bacterium]